MPRDPSLDPVGVPLAELLRPGAAVRVQLARRVALDVPRELLQLNPEDRPPFRRSARIDRRRLAHDDRRFGGKQPALRLVHGPRHAVETWREMDQRRPPESLVALPPRHFGEREMDLHLRATEPMAARAGLDRGG